MSNLMINAQQAMPDGGAIQISARNVRLGNHEATTLPPGDYALISVKDHGMGMPAEALPRIFDPFFTTKEQGRGLGLSTCHSIMQRHDGAITVESTPGQGSTFHLYLPAARSSDGLPAEVKPVLRHRGSGRVLVMDDERAIRDVFSAMLTALGYSVETVVDGSVAVRIFADAYKAGRPFSAAILDLTVPGGMGGSEAALALRAMDSDVALFVTSGYAEDPVMAKPTDFGFNASLRKPFEKSELSELLEKYCKRKDRLSA
jgi:CheY-like chemotaxis protein